MRGLLPTLLLVFGAWSTLPPASAGESLAPENGVFIRIIKDSLVHGANAKRWEDSENSHGVKTMYSQNWGELELWIYSPPKKKYEHFRSYPLCMYSGYPGPKHREGDYQSPEGFYSIHRGDLNPHSQYVLSLDVGFPNAYDRFHRYTGSDIKIHGMCESAGCFAMNDDIYEIYDAVERALKSNARVDVHIFPFAMTDENWSHLDPHSVSEDVFAFWLSLQPGFRIFEEKGIPPEVSVDKEGQYVFN